jgi:hypothetical protein
MAIGVAFFKWTEKGVQGYREGLPLMAGST